MPTRVHRRSHPGGSDRRPDECGDNENTESRMDAHNHRTSKNENRISLNILASLNRVTRIYNPLQGEILYTHPPPS